MEKPLEERANALLDELFEIAREFRNRQEFIHTNNIQNQVRFLRALRDVKETVADIESQLGKVLEKMRQETIPNSFNETGVTTLTVDGFRFTISQTMRASIKADKKADAYEWLRENDLGDLITLTVNASTLSAQARKMAEDGMELEPDLFNVSIVPNTSITQAK
jgi:hypothetical protein